jgi:hypothetical protein
LAVTTSPSDARMRHVTPAIDAMKIHFSHIS